MICSSAISGEAARSKAHEVRIDPAIGGQCPHHNAVGTQFPGAADVGQHHRFFHFAVQEITGARPYQHVLFEPLHAAGSLHESGRRCQPAGFQAAAKFNAMGASPAGSLHTVDGGSTYFQYHEQVIV